MAAEHSANGPTDDPLGTGGPGERDGPEDRDLLAAHVGGDPVAFGLLFARHRDRLWAVALRTTGNPEDAADALQDAMISAFRRAETFRGDAQVTTWLHRIVVNACLDRIRRAKVRAVSPLPDDLEDHAARGDVLAAVTDDPEEAAERSDVRRRVLHALEQLPPEQRSALVLVDLQGYAVDEAARILDCPTGTIKSRCSRGRTRLAGLLGDLAPGGGTDPPPGASHPGRPRRPPASGGRRGRPQGYGPGGPDGPDGPDERSAAPAPDQPGTEQEPAEQRPEEVT